MSLTATPVVTLHPAWNSIKTQRFNTIAQETTALQSGVYISGCLSPVWDFTWSIPLLQGRMDDPTSTVAQFNGLFNICKGRGGSFLFADPGDNTVTNYQFGTGDGTSKVFQLTRPIGAGSEIVQNLNGPPVITVAGTVVTLLSIDALGVVTFNTAPALGAAIVWSGEFLFRLKFKADTLSDMTEFYNGMWSVGTIELESVNR